MPLHPRDDDEMHVHATLLPTASVSDSDSEQAVANGSSTSSGIESSNAALTTPTASSNGSDVITVNDDSDDSGDSDAKTSASVLPLPRAVAAPAPQTLQAASLRDRVSTSPFAAPGAAHVAPAATPAARPPSATHATPQPPIPTSTAGLPPAQHVPIAIPAASDSPADDAFLRMSEHCASTHCLRVQWEAEMNPRCPAKTQIASDGNVYIFDGFYLLCHGDPPSVPQFEYTRSGVMCKLQFIAEPTPAIFRLPPSPPAAEASSSTAATNAAAVPTARQSFCQTLFLLQRYLFAQLLRLQPLHLFNMTFPDPLRPVSDVSDTCSDYHIVPRFVAINQAPLLNREDLLAPHRIGFAVGHYLSIDRILRHLDESARLPAAAFIAEFDAHQLVDSVVSTRVNGDTPFAFRVDALVDVEEKGDTELATAGVRSKDGRYVVALQHTTDGAWHYDGAKTKKKIRKWKALGPFLQLSPSVEPLHATFPLLACHLTGLRTDMLEVASAMPMALKHIRHCLLLASFETRMGLAFTNKSLLRQAFTHASYVDVGMQSVNTSEATFSRVHVGHAFVHTALLKRSREQLFDPFVIGDVDGSDVATSMDAEVAQIAATHLGNASEFQQEFHSRFSCPYERLEFLGDSVLSFLVATSTFLKVPNASEKDLHQMRVDVANNKTLGAIARTANLESLLLSAFDVVRLDAETTTKIVADCFEALLGALYKDQGIVPCRALLGKLIARHDADLHDLFYLTTPEVAAKATAYVALDANALQQSSTKADVRIRHRRFTTTTNVVIQHSHLWLQSMTHGSFQAPQIAADAFLTTDPTYERLEFLGDAVLQLLSAAFLVDAFPYYQEHLLTQVRSSLVKNTRLAQVAQALGYEEFVRLGDQAKRPGSNLYVGDVLADTFEATLGAVWLEHVDDLTNVNAILERTLFPLVKEAIRRREWMQPRKVLAHHVGQWARASGRPIDCKFKNLSRAASAKTTAGGNDTDHIVALYVNNALVARGRGRTILAAQDAACSKGLRQFGMKFT